MNKLSVEQCAIGAAMRDARAQGCVCAVEVIVEHWVGGEPSTITAHDDWCPLLRAMQERDEPSITHVLF